MLIGLELKPLYLKKKMSTVWPFLDCKLYEGWLDVPSLKTRTQVLATFSHPRIHLQIDEDDAILSSGLDWVKDILSPSSGVSSWLSMTRTKKLVKKEAAFCSHPSLDGNTWWSQLWRTVLKSVKHHFFWFPIGGNLVMDSLRLFVFPITTQNMHKGVILDVDRDIHCKQL